MSEPVTFIFDLSALPAPLQHEFALMGAFIIQMDRLNVDARNRIMSYLNGLYALRPV